MYPSKVDLNLTFASMTNPASCGFEQDFGLLLPPAMFESCSSLQHLYRVKHDRPQDTLVQLT